MKKGIKTYYTVIIYLNTFSKPFSYIIPKSEFNRIFKFYSTFRKVKEDNDTIKFISFETAYKITVFISIKDTQFINFLWDMTSPKSNPTKDNELLQFFFRGRAEPIIAECDEPAQVLELTSILDDNDLRAEGEDFFTLNDIDGENFVVNIDLISLLEVDSGLIKDGLKNLK